MDVDKVMVSGSKDEIQVKAAEDEGYQCEEEDRVKVTESESNQSREGDEAEVTEIESHQCKDEDKVEVTESESHQSREGQKFKVTVVKGHQYKEKDQVEITKSENLNCYNNFLEDTVVSMDVDENLIVSGSVDEGQIKVAENECHQCKEEDQVEVTESDSHQSREGNKVEVAVFASHQCKEEDQVDVPESENCLGREEDKVKVTKIEGRLCKEGDVKVKESEGHQSREEVQVKVASIQNELLGKLGLSEYFPEKISLQLAIKKSLSKVEDLTDIPWWFLNKMLMLDYRGRDDIASLSITNKLGTGSENEVESEIGDEFDNLFAEVTEDLSCTTSSFIALHPMDVQITVFRCCSNFLRQILSEKMFMCKLSIPLLLPPFLNRESEFLIWSLRNITLEVRQASGELCEESIVDHPLPVVSCVKLGKISRSKSKVLNEILNGQSHPTFYHRDCDGGMLHRSISEGLVEVAWNLHSQRYSELTKDDVTSSGRHCQKFDFCILNLRGDGILHETSCKFLYQISDVVIVIVDVIEFENQFILDSLRSIKSYDAQVVLMLTKKQNDRVIKKQTLKRCLELVRNEKSIQYRLPDFNTQGEKNVKCLKKELETMILKCVESRCSNRNLSNCQDLAESLGINVDENIPDCYTGREGALEVVKILSETSMNNCRSTKLPLQCGPWQEWSKFNKEEHRRERRGEENISTYMGKLHFQKKEQRKIQLTMIHTHSKLFNSFLESLFQYEGEKRLFYLKWLKFLLDNISRSVLPELQKKHSLKWNEISLYGEGRNKSELLRELAQIGEELKNSSISLEHLFREMAQSYEAVKDVGWKKSEIPRKFISLPKMMAELMLLGYPLELMDGDVGSIPLSWIQAVLGKLIGLIGNKSIFVLSVLGVQSSGKSTMLNTMFGLQFAASAGRCTRGAWAQLVPIPDVYSSDIYDYILVVDTEGLRATELGFEKIQHDNEIATLVIGLGDVTLINIKGENTIELEDVLQIVIHALLKMKSVNKNITLQPSCLFIHQNVSAPDAAWKLRGGQQKFIETLDKVTEVSGKQEDMPQYTKFSQIIDLNINTDISYFSDLWSGDPPMAHVNHGYSESISRTRQALLKDVLHKRNSHLNLAKFSMKIRDIWNGILEQNFVFNFRNSLEIEAYRSLETKLADIFWGLKKTALMWQNDIENEIFGTEDGIENLKLNMKGECSQKLDDVYSAGKENLKKFFQMHEDATILERWHASTFRKLENCREDVIDRTVKALNLKISMRLIQIDQKNNIDKYKSDILIAAKLLADDLKSREGKQCLDDKELKTLFDDKWEQWEQNLPKGCMYSVDIKDTIKKILYGRFHQDIAIVKACIDEMEREEKCILHENFEMVIENHVSQRKRFLFARDSDSKISIGVFMQDIYKQIGILVKTAKGKGLKPEVGLSLLAISKDFIEKLKRSGLTISDEEKFEFSITVCICQYATYELSGQCKADAIGNGEFGLNHCGILPYLEELLFSMYSSKLTSEISSISHKDGLSCLKVRLLLQCTKLSSKTSIVQLDDEIQAYVSKPEIQDFREEYVEEIIKIVMDKTWKDRIEKKLKISLCIYACFFALPQFVEKHRRFADSLNPRKVLRKDYYGPYLQLFKNFQRAAANEVALSAVLSEYISSAIETAVDKKLATKLAEAVRNNVPELKTKCSLVNAILVNLLKREDFQEFIYYLENTSYCLQRWISHFINKYLFSLGDNGFSQYTKIAALSVTSLIGSVCQDILDVKIVNKFNVFHWISDFHSKVFRKIAVSLQDLMDLANQYQILSLESFSAQLEKNLRASEDKLRHNFQQHSPHHLKYAHSDSVYKLIYRECKGCKEKCPFCYAPCIMNTGGHVQDKGVKHMAKEHYPEACGRMRWANSEVLIIENCSVLVASHCKFKNSQTNFQWHFYNRYQQVYPDWKIDSNPSVEASPYWKWFLVRYKSQLAKRYKMKEPSIPDSWRSITKHNVEESLKN